MREQKTTVSMWSRGMVCAMIMAAGEQVCAESAHPHHGVDGQKHEIVEHGHAGAGSALDLWEKMTTQANARGFSFAGEFIYEYSNVLDGGVQAGGSDRNLLVFDAELDLEKSMDLKGATVFAQFLHASRERGGTMDTGDLQGFSNMEVGRSLDALYELWFQQTFAEGRLRIKIGKVDANSEFAYVDAAGGFAHASAGFSPTIFALPTYPDPAMSANVFATLAENRGSTLTLGYGFFDGASAVDGLETGRRGPSTFFSKDKSNDYFQVVQLEQGWEKFGGLGAGRCSLGAWYHNGRFETFSGDIDAGTGGFFVTAEQQIVERDGEEDAGVVLFVQYGSADEMVSEVAQHVAVGLVSQGTFGGRDDDAAGVYLSYVDLSDVAAAGFSQNECALDVFYTLQLNAHFSVQPELQYIWNPSGDDTVSDALVGGVRCSMAF